MLLWLILGFILGAGALWLWKNPRVRLAWFDWLVALIAVVFYVLAIVNYNGSMEELEPRAAMFLLASFGIPALLLTVIVVIRALRTRQSGGAAA